MGSPESDKDAASDEKPQHRVRITKPFYLGKYLVTQEQWVAVMGSNPSHSRGRRTRWKWSVGTIASSSWRSSTRSPARGEAVPIADRSPVGICLPGGKHDALLLWGR